MHSSHTYQTPEMLCNIIAHWPPTINIQIAISDLRDTKYFLQSFDLNRDRIKRITQKSNRTRKHEKKGRGWGTHTKNQNA